ncbi:MAG: putative lipoprotein, partial [Myxococcaceae bacterium]|nr:putative lipoprotein [Myxococcaceae bacterium]
RQTEQALEGAAAARKALEIFGVLPSYSCGPLSGAIGKALPPVSVPFSCVSLTTRPDGLDLAFAAEGCDVGGHVVKGTLGLDLGFGEDRIDVSADFRQLSVDGEVLPVRIGAGVCGDEKRIWATIDGVKVADSVFRLDARLGYRKGLPLIGHTDLTLDGTGSLEQPAPAGKTELAAEGVEYELGAMLPKAGRLTLERTSGPRVSVRFTEVLWKVGKAEITVGDRAPVEVPILN